MQQQCHAQAQLFQNYKSLIRGTKYSDLIMRGTIEFY